MFKYSKSLTESEYEHNRDQNAAAEARICSFLLSYNFGAFDKAAFSHQLSQINSLELIAVGKGEFVHGISPRLEQPWNGHSFGWPRLVGGQDAYMKYNREKTKTTLDIADIPYARLAGLIINRLDQQAYARENRDEFEKLCNAIDRDRRSTIGNLFAFLKKIAVDVDFFETHKEEPLPAIVSAVTKDYMAQPVKHAEKYANLLFVSQIKGFGAEQADLLSSKEAEIAEFDRLLRRNDSGNYHWAKEELKICVRTGILSFPNQRAIEGHVVRAEEEIFQMTNKFSNLFHPTADEISGRHNRAQQLVEPITKLFAASLRADVAAPG